MRIEDLDITVVPPLGKDTHGYKNITLPTSYDEIKYKYNAVLRNAPDIFQDVHPQFGLNYAIDGQMTHDFDYIMNRSNYPNADYTDFSYEEAFMARDAGWAVINLAQTKYSQNVARYKIFKMHKLRHVWGVSLVFGFFAYIAGMGVNIMRTGILTATGVVLQPIDKLFFYQRSTMYMDSRYPDTLQTMYDKWRTKNDSLMQLTKNEYNVDLKKLTTLSPDYLTERLSYMRFQIDRAWNTQLYPSRYSPQTQIKRLQDWLNAEMDKRFNFSKKAFLKQEVARESRLLNAKQTIHKYLPYFFKSKIILSGLLSWKVIIFHHFRGLYAYIFIGPMLYACDVVVPRILALIRDDATPGEAYAITTFVFISSWTYLWRVHHASQFTFWHGIGLGAAWFAFAHMMNILMYGKYWMPVVFPWDTDFKFDEKSNVKKFFKRVDARVENFNATSESWKAHTAVENYDLMIEGIEHEFSDDYDVVFAEEPPKYNPFKYADYRIAELVADADIPELNDFTKSMRDRKLPSPVSDESKEQYKLITEALEKQRVD